MKHLPSFFTCPLSACTGADANRAPTVIVAAATANLCMVKLLFSGCNYNPEVALTQDKQNIFYQETRQHEFMTVNKNLCSSAAALGALGATMIAGHELTEVTYDEKS
jgi:hypothetical protein